MIPLAIYLCMHACIDNNSFPDKCVEVRPAPCKKSYSEMCAYHRAYDNAESR